VGFISPIRRSESDTRYQYKYFAHEQKLFATFLKNGYNRIIMKNKTNQKEITMRRNLTNSDTAEHKCYHDSIGYFALLNSREPK